MRIIPAARNLPKGEVNLANLIYYELANLNSSRLREIFLKVQFKKYNMKNEKQKSEGWSHCLFF